MSWGSRIASITERPEFQNSTIRIIDPSLDDSDDGGYDPDTGLPTGGSADLTVYEGRARIVPRRDGNFDRNEPQSNPTTIIPIRVQIPRTPATDVRVRRGCKVFVLESPDSLALTDRVFTITSDIQGSVAASRTFEAAADVDAYVPTSGFGRSEAMRDGYGE